MYLITGGCGFIGSHIAEALAADGESVRVFDNLSTGHLRNIEPLGSRAEFARGDVLDAAALRAAMKGVAGVFHEAALVSVFKSVEQPRANHEINITGTLNVLMAARECGVRRVVLASSSAVYGNAPELPKREDMRPEPVSPYGMAKLAGEHYGSIFAKLYGVEVVSLRYFNVYGPRQDPSSMYSGVISRFVSAARKGMRPTFFGDGKQTRDFVYVKDVVDGNLSAMRTPTVGQGEIFNVATGRETSLLDILDALKRLTGRDLDPEFREAREGDIRRSVADIASATHALGYRARFTLGDGLADLLGWEGRASGAAAP